MNANSTAIGFHCQSYDSHLICCQLCCESGSQLSDESDDMSSAECPNCGHLTEVIGQQKTKINLIEVRLKDLVKAYKKVCLERDNLLAISSTAVLPSNDCHELQKRLSTLEASVANMSAICGDYESQRIKDKQLIDELTSKCEQWASQVKSTERLDDKPLIQVEEPVRKFRHKGVQTEDSYDFMSDDHKDILSENNSSKEMFDIETQTESQLDFDVFNVSHRKKTELAVVLPTLSEKQIQSTPRRESDSHSDLNQSDRVSNQSNSPHSFDSNLDNYPVFASNEKPTTPSNDIPYPNPTSSGVSLFYANELARKEIDLAETRIQAREHECALRELQWKYNTEKYRLQSRINELEKNLSQITYNQPMSQLTITYVRNVLLKLLNTKDKQQKQFMINAILTALEPKDRKPK